MLTCNCLNDILDSIKPIEGTDLFLRLWKVFVGNIDRHTDKGSPLGGYNTPKKLRICDRGDIGSQFYACAYWDTLLVFQLTRSNKHE